MKKATWALAIATGFALTSITAINATKQVGTSISGKVAPAEAADSVSATSSTKETIKTAVKDGAFMLPVKAAGKYTVIVSAKAPFKSVTKEATVENGKNTDLGTIALEQ
jgi:hypothetical protein